MKVSEFDYNLPKELIAQEPSEKRDHSNLLVYQAGKVEHKHFFDILAYLQAGDILVLNDSKVFPARLLGKRSVTGGQVEVFLLSQKDEDTWYCLLGGTRMKVGLKIDFDYRLQGEIIEEKSTSKWLVRFNKVGQELMDTIMLIGKTPLPPYIKTADSPQTRDRYQTVYAEHTGSVAAPTAGLHFTNELIEQISAKGVDILRVTLHVGLGTFAPVKVENIRDHHMHSEYFAIKDDVWNKILRAKENNKRIVAVGTTAVRVLETAAKSKVLQGWTDIFIYPGYKFLIVDSLITNFHLPKSTLMMLVAAFLQDKGVANGIKELKDIYQEAIDHKYRFFSFGDAMIINI